jgi:hypothetical protein
VVGVEPVAGLMLSQLPPDVVAVYCNTVPLLAIARFCVPAVLVPDAYVNDKLPGVMLNDAPLGGAPVTLRLTVIFCDAFDAPAELTVTFPV